MKIRSCWFVFILCALLSACGGGGGGGGDSGDTTSPPDTTPPTGGIGRTGVAVGPIANFGSIVVNGVRYDTDSATILTEPARSTVPRAPPNASSTHMPNPIRSHDTR